MKKFIKKTLLFGILSNIKHNIIIAKARAAFYKKYSDSNKLTPNSIFPIEIVEAGKYSYGELNVITFGKEYKLKIGNYVSIAQNVKFILQAEHNIHTVSTYPYKVKLLGNIEPEAFAKGDITVADDVWIGYGATIMSGVTIGQGAVVATGAVVTKDVPPYAIVGGVPAKVIKYRFDSEMIKELLKIDYSKLTDDMIKKHIDELYTELTSVEQIEWMK